MAFKARDPDARAVGAVARGHARRLLFFWVNNISAKPHDFVASPLVE